MNALTLDDDPNSWSGPASSDGRRAWVRRSSAAPGAGKDGRDHWPHCFSSVLAGAGIHGGSIYGASDRFAAYPARDPVTPADIAATVYHLLGVDPARELIDPLGRPFRVCPGDPITGVLA